MISADGVTGGSVEVAAGGDISLADHVSERGTGGAGGSVSYTSGGRLIETTTSHTDVSGQTDGGTIRAIADGGILSLVRAIQCYRNNRPRRAHRYERR